MKSCKIWNSKLEGELLPIPSKSTIHRSLIAALLCQSVTKISNLIDSTDVKTTIQILVECGCEINYEQNAIIIDSTNLKMPKMINVEESGSTLRFIVPVMLFLFEYLQIEAKEGLIKRPHDLFIDIFKQSDIEYQEQISFPLKVEGKLKPNTYRLAGNISSQFISGLLFVLPLLEEDSEIIFTTPLQSRGYLQLTIDVLSDFGIAIDFLEDNIKIKGNQSYKKNHQYTNEVDESNIAFWRVANELGANITFKYENATTSQPDNVLVDIIKSEQTVVSVKECPDLLPILAVYGCSKQSGLKIIDTERTKIKESNRLIATYEELKKIGANIKIDENENLIIKYSPKLKTAVVNSHNDHRIVMAMAISSLLVDQEIIIKDIEAINKSYPNFFTDFERLGGIFTLM